MIYGTAIVLSVFALAAGVAWLDREPGVSGESAHQAVVADVTPPPAPTIAVVAKSSRPARLVYRFSVVPGGAYSDAELRRAMQRDPIVAAHYKQVGTRKLRPEIVKADRLVHVSYRDGDRVFWTKNKITLHRGETILTDGTIQIRARCGNCIAEEPAGATSDAEPVAEEFEHAEPEVVQEPEAAGGGPVTVAQGGGVSGGGGAPVAAPARVTSAAPIIFPAAGVGFIRTGGSIATKTQAVTQDPAPSVNPEAEPAQPPVETIAEAKPTPDVPIGDPSPEPPRNTPPSGGPAPETPVAPDTPTDPINPVPVPEPGTYLLVGGGVAALLRKLRGRR